MIEHVIDTGTDGKMRIRDRTDEPDVYTVELALTCFTPIVIEELPWAFSRNGDQVPWRSYHFDSTGGGMGGGFMVGEWQRVHLMVPEPYVEVFGFHIADTATTEMGGPSDLVINLYSAGEGQVDVKVDDIWKRATLYVKHNDTWKPATPYVKDNDIWKPVV